jgi:hypothetical protein
MKKSEWIIVGIGIYLLIFYTGWVKESCNISDVLSKDINTGYSLKFMSCEKYLGFLDPGSIRTYEYTSIYILVNDKNKFIEKISDYQNTASVHDFNNPFEPKYVSSDNKILLNNGDIITFKDKHLIKLTENDSNLSKNNILDPVYISMNELSSKEANLAYNKNKTMDIYSFLSKFRIENIFKQWLIL